MDRDILDDLTPKRASDKGNPLEWLKARRLLVAMDRFESMALIASDNWPFDLSAEHVAILQYPSSQEARSDLIRAMVSAVNHSKLKPTGFIVHEWKEFKSGLPSELKIPVINPHTFFQWFNGLDTPSEYIKAWANAWQAQEQTEDNPSTVEGLNLNTERERDGWTPAIVEVANNLFSELNGNMPNEHQIFSELSKNPPHGYGISIKGNTTLQMIGEKDLTKALLKKRWHRMTDKDK